MNLNMIKKSLLIALPLLALGACSSTTEMETPEVMEPVKEAVMEKPVETDVVEAVQTLTEEELMVQKYSAAILEKTVLFDFNESAVKTEFTRILQAHAAYLVEHPNKSLTVEGYADERGTPEYNIALGERRAKAVAAFFESMGVNSSQLSIVSYGEEKPANTEHNESAWIENRRAELVF